jgi:hypothetical protein
MSDYAESMEIEFEGEQETGIVEPLDENEKEAQEADKAQEEEELIVQTQAIEEPELKEYDDEEVEEEEERDLSQEHVSISYQEIEVVLPDVVAYHTVVLAGVTADAVDVEPLEPIAEVVAVEENVSAIGQPDELADRKDQAPIGPVEEKSDNCDGKSLNEQGDSMETLVQIEEPVDSACMEITEAASTKESLEDKEPDVVQDSKTSHLPSVHLRYDFGNTSCGPSAMYKDDEALDEDEEEPHLDAAPSVTASSYSD